MEIKPADLTAFTGVNKDHYSQRVGIPDAIGRFEVAHLFLPLETVIFKERFGPKNS